MYEAFFGLNDKPFSLTPNPRYVFYSQQYREAEGQLLYGINNREGFMLVTGQPGTGKTTLCRDAPPPRPRETAPGRGPPARENQFPARPASARQELRRDLRRGAAPLD